MPDRAFDVLDHLRGGVVFGDLDEQVLHRVASSLQPDELAPGGVLIAEGDPAGDAWILMTGRLRVSTLRNGYRVTVADLGPGSIVGEMSLITGARRSATVRALRACRLLRIPADEFEDIVVSDSEVLLQVARTVVQRLERTTHDHLEASAVSVIGVIPAGSDPRHLDFAHRFAETPSRFRDVGVVTSSGVAGSIGRDHTEAALLDHLQRVEAQHELTLLVADETLTPWTRWCVSHADVRLLVGHTSGLDDRGAAEAVLETDHAPGTVAPAHLVVLSDDGRTRGTRRHLRLRGTPRHHHVRLWSDADHQHLVRVLSGSTVGVVLSGGGARGFAHLGVLKALVEAGIPVDHIGGASIGAVVAGVYATGWDWETMVARGRMATVERRSLVDFSFPSVALAAGTRLRDSIHDLYGDVEIEDLITEFYCTSTDLANGEPYVHREGPLWAAVRSSVAIPGVFPPMPADGGRLLVDGGVLDGLPTAVMQDEFAPATMIASDLQGSAPLPVEDLRSSGVISGWEVLRRRYLPGTPALRLPRAVDILTRASAVTGHRSGELADLVIRPPVQAYGMLDFDAHAELVEVGYRYTAEMLEEWQRPEECGPRLTPDEIKRRLGG